jgi:hypothetical protein
VEVEAMATMAMAGALSMEMLEIAMAVFTARPMQLITVLCIMEAMLRSGIRAISLHSVVEVGQATQVKVATTTSSTRIRIVMTITNNTVITTRRRSFGTAAITKTSRAAGTKYPSLFVPDSERCSFLSSQACLGRNLVECL